MKRIKLLIATAEQSIAAVETPDKKKEQLELAKGLAPKILTGVWLELAIIALNLLEATIKTAA
jgi:hypothetical protein